MNVPARTHRTLIPKLMNRRNIATMIEIRILNFVAKNINHKNYIVKNIILNFLSDCNSYFLGIFNRIILKYGIKFIDIFKNKKLLLNETKNDNDWKIKIINELLDFNDKVKVDGFSKEEIKFLLHNLCSDQDTKLIILKK